MLENNFMGDDFVVVKSPLAETLGVPVNDLKITDDSKLGTAPTYNSERESSELLRFEPNLKVMKPKGVFDL